VCYGITNDKIKFSITSIKDCPDTSASRMKDAIERALLDMQRLCLTRNVMYVGTEAKI
jgi:hypothetical protein